MRAAVARAVAALVAAFVLASLTVLARADEPDEPACGTPEQVTDQLGTRYGEAIESVHRSGPADVVIYANPAAGTWTLVVMAEGRACVAYVGRDPASGSGGRPAA